MNLYKKELSSLCFPLLNPKDKEENPCIFARDVFCVGSVCDRILQSVMV